eukprot:CAMPEP_0178911884 /NCGR_PEP_ID=MMETSP0786-20121207/9947_1 /TAXON_ID=186022 /ORGANISM="Thalassionema frauenfeldii, Strain CCMP 1798" /LENGTH=654 /DNA_ID=CAMNT_0020584389 /DNA_START=355 /DNA_END=2319 /DNA_ORIENTATION=-
MSQEAATTAIGSSPVVDNLVQQTYFANTESDSTSKPSFGYVDNRKNNEQLQQDENEEEEESSSSFWNIIVTLYLPLILVWFRRSMFGTANLIRSLLIGQLMRLVLAQCAELPKWIQVFVEPPPASSSSGDRSVSHLELPKWAQAFMDPHAWPPPAFTALAILTLLAFVVHPDGLTWFMLGKLRDAILSILHSIVSCWTMFIQDYGIITTTIALMTLAGIGCLLSILLKNALPKANSSKRALPPEKKKKKRKGVKGKSGRIRNIRNNSSSITKPIQQNAPQDSSERCSIPERVPSKPLIETQTPESLISIPVSNQVDENLNVPNETLGIAAEKQNLDSAMEPTELVVRPFALSGDILSDDTSCDSASLRSFSSAPTAVVTLGSTGNSESTKSGKHTKRTNRRKPNNASSKRGVKKGLSVSNQGEHSFSDKAHVSPRHSTSSNNTRQSKTDAQGCRHANHNSKQTSSSQGRFANLKEKDTRFEHTSRRNASRSNGKGRSQHGRQNRNPNFRSQQNQQRSTENNFTFADGAASQRATFDKQQNSFVQYGIPNEQDHLYAAQPDKPGHVRKMPNDRPQHREFRPPPGLSPIHDEPPTLFGSASKSSSLPLPTPSFQQKPLEHPFAYDEHQEQTCFDDESRIEAELQELGGQMIGSILD